jgi:hypothetical protein
VRLPPIPIPLQILIGRPSACITNIALMEAMGHREAAMDTPSYVDILFRIRVRRPGVRTR